MIVSHDEQELLLRVRQLRWEADGVLSVHLESPDGSPLPDWSPGAHIDLHLPGVITRQYSLCGSTMDKHSWRIAVLREPISRGGSAAVHETLRPGDLVRVVGPRNNFGLVESPRYLFLAGGIGITPLLPMIEQVAATGADWRLVYGGRQLTSMAFVDDLRERYAGAVDVLPRCSEPRRPTRWSTAADPSRCSVPWKSAAPPGPGARCTSSASRRNNVRPRTRTPSRPSTWTSNGPA